MLALVLAGCTGGSSGTDSAPSPAATVAVAATPSARQLAAFVTAFRQQYPSLAANQSAAALASSAENTCQDAQDGLDRESLLSGVAVDFESVYKISDATAADILSWVELEVCPQE